MRLGVIPVEFFLSLPDFVAVLIDDRWEPMIHNPFTNDETDVFVEVYLTRHACQGCATPHKMHRRATNRGKLLAKRIDKKFIVGRRREWMTYPATRINPARLGEWR